MAAILCEKLAQQQASKSIFFSRGADQKSSTGVSWLASKVVQVTLIALWRPFARRVLCSLAFPQDFTAEYRYRRRMREQTSYIEVIRNPQLNPV
jgi:hypothetical protein